MEPNMTPDTYRDRAGPETAPRSLSALAAHARAKLERHADAELAERAIVARAGLGDAQAIRQLEALERYNRTGGRVDGVPALSRRHSGGGFATCGRCGAILPGSLHCRSCGHISIGDHKGSVRRSR